jgi:hypothetical protein
MCTVSAPMWRLCFCVGCSTAKSRAPSGTSRWRDAASR